MSFKYRFIVSFVLLEVFFIVLIVSVNFIAINNSSNKLIKEQIESNITFLEEMLKVPLSIYDLATMDNLLYKTEELRHIDSIVVLDSNKKILSEVYNFKHFSLDELIQFEKDFKYEIDDENYEIRYKEIKEDETQLGSIYIVFDTSENKQFISKNIRNTLSIIFIEILFSTLLSYLIGSRLTRMLTNLSDVAKEIGETKTPEIPYKNNKDEIGVLANSLNKMQFDLKTRREKLKLLTKDLEEQKEELIIANKAKDDFLANMSHELKTPLNSINIISSVMSRNKEENLSEKDVYNLNMINKCGHDLLYLINDMLDISKLEANQIVLNKEDINLKLLIKDITEIFKPQVTNKNLELKVSVEDSIKFIHNDKQRIKQIVENLLSNALKFTARGKIEVQVKDKNNFIEILVKDEGIGIKEDKLEHIFDRFKQAEESTSRRYGGTGLGLAICKELSILLGGDIKVQSIFGKGSIFRVFIPKNEEEIKSLENIDKKDVLVAKEKRKTVLILNKNPINMFRIIVGLNQYLNVEQVNSIDDFIESKKRKNYDLYIIDVENEDIEKIEKIEEKEVLLLVDKNKIGDSLSWFETIDKTLDSKEIIKQIKDK
ncbi:MAG: ATP-binding protein [Halarcobacter ebronensis]|uniref:sensor histidine kinase n=1 Tax=Halarcobacter ebronensis TaxID=1462615 RepID=UPI003C78B422